MNSDINRILQIKSYFYMVKKAKQKIEKILRTKKAFKKAIFIIFKALLRAKNCLRPKGAPLSLFALLNTGLSRQFFF